MTKFLETINPSVNVVNIVSPNQNPTKQKKEQGIAIEIEENKKRQAETAVQDHFNTIEEHEKQQDDEN